MERRRGARATRALDGRALAAGTAPHRAAHSPAAPPSSIEEDPPSARQATGSCAEGNQRGRRLRLRRSPTAQVLEGGRPLARRAAGPRCAAWRRCPRSPAIIGSVWARRSERRAPASGLPIVVWPITRLQRVPRSPELFVAITKRPRVLQAAARGCRESWRVVQCAQGLAGAHRASDNFK